ncbi:MAG: hypothetical protein Q8N88_00605 [Nanoarchaeota archaeon]|nr:hypothetical protein [Nanoarchaeota archaeon]
MKGLMQFGLDVRYSALKNYYNEFRLLPKKLFRDMCNIANLDFKSFEVVLSDNNWGKVKGGKTKN